MKPIVIKGLTSNLGYYIYTICIYIYNNNNNKYIYIYTIYIYIYNIYIYIYLHQQDLGNSQGLFGNPGFKGKTRGWLIHCSTDEFIFLLNLMETTLVPESKCLSLEMQRETTHSGKKEPQRNPALYIEYTYIHSVYHFCFPELGSIYPSATHWA